ncbi:hypothetical protein Tco_0098774 [Tanacetum coccineum]
MHTIRMTMQQVQVNTKFLNALPSEWSKFVTDVNLAKSLYTTNYDQLYTDPLALVANSPTLYNLSQSPQHSGSLMYPPPQQFTPVYAASIHRKHHHTLEAGQTLDEEQLAFLAHPGISEALVAQQTIPHNLAFQTEDLDAYDSDCDDLSSAKAVLMANLSSYDSNVLSEEIDTLKETLSNHVKEKESLSKTLTVFKTKSKEKESNNAYANKTTSFYDNTHKQALGYQNPFQYLKKARWIQLTLYDGSVIAKEHVVISVIDDEETLILEEESRSKMLDKQNDPISIEKKIKISPN